MFIKTITGTGTIDFTLHVSDIETSVPNLTIKPSSLPSKGVLTAYGSNADTNTAYAINAITYTSHANMELAHALSLRTRSFHSFRARGSSRK